MARKSGKRQGIHRGVVLFAVVLMLVPGGIFFAKGARELADRFAPRATHEATLRDLEIARRQSDPNAPTRYLVRGETSGGDDFEVDDRQVYDIADGRTPLPVRVEVSSFSGRVLAVRSDFGNVDGVGGATQLPLALLGLVLGGSLAAIPFLLPWQPAQRKRAKAKGKPPPPVDRGALILVSVSAVVIVGGTLVWDIVR